MDAEIIQELMGCRLSEEEATPVELVESDLTDGLAECEGSKRGISHQRCGGEDWKYFPGVRPFRRLVSFRVGELMVSGYLAYERLPNMCFHCGKLGHLIKQCPELEPGDDCTNRVVYGLWIKAPPERSCIEFKLQEESAFQASPLVLIGHDYGRLGKGMSWRGPRFRRERLPDYCKSEERT
ncbi:hypothetical protein LIER_28982 [Lithospermum erythrorhizon]|uniref:CCHC-type domain-containing protein n=1 Tax=Lithospermum erythrorhizon TaxID=34254 RepID=A0AAV3RL91_LITER